MELIFNFISKFFILYHAKINYFEDVDHLARSTRLKGVQLWIYMECGAGSIPSESGKFFTSL